MPKKTYVLKPTLKLWGAIRVVAWVFIASAALLAVSSVYQLVLLSGFAASDYMIEDDVYSLFPLATVVMGLVSIPYILAYLVGAFMVLMWYLRSVRNATMLHRGLEITPGWVIWAFIVPVISLFKPYGMTSELWRSSLKPDGWKGLPDPRIMRVWWGCVLAGGIISAVSNPVLRSASTAVQIQIATILTAVAFASLAVAGVLFLKIGGPISQRQSALIAQGYRPPETGLPAWSA